MSRLTWATDYLIGDFPSFSVRNPAEQRSASRDCGGTADAPVGGSELNQCSMAEFGSRGSCTIRCRPQGGGIEKRKAQGMCLDSPRTNRAHRGRNSRRCAVGSGLWYRARESRRVNPQGGPSVSLGAPIVVKYNDVNPEGEGTTAGFGEVGSRLQRTQSGERDLPRHDKAKHCLLGTPGSRPPQSIYVL